jgi:hypothetical protein
MSGNRLLVGSLVLVSVVSGCGDRAQPAVDVGADLPPRPDLTARDTRPLELDRALDLRADLPPRIDLRLLPDLLPIGDQPRPPDGPVIMADLGATPFTDYVQDSLTLPAGSSTAQGYGLLFNGQTYNALGAILGALSNIAPSMNLQDLVTSRINQGALISLLRVQAASFTTAPSALGKYWQGKSQTCCTSPTLPTVCAAQARATCFSGTYTFTPSPTQPNPSLAPGTISGGKMILGPATIKVLFPIGAALMPLTLKSATIRGTLVGNDIPDGILAGAIPQSEVNGVVVPSTAGTLDRLYKDPATPSSTRSLLLVLFDTNGDGTISTSEVAGNALIKTFLAGDVDVDNDGVAELSLGWGFTAVGAMIQP